MCTPTHRSQERRSGDARHPSRRTVPLRLRPNPTDAGSCRQNQRRRSDDCRTHQRHRPTHAPPSPGPPRDRPRCRQARSAGLGSCCTRARHRSGAGRPGSTWVDRRIDPLSRSVATSGTRRATISGRRHRRCQRSKCCPCNRHSIREYRAEELRPRPPASAPGLPSCRRRCHRGRTESPAAPGSTDPPPDATNRWEENRG